MENEQNKSLFKKGSVPWNKGKEFNKKELTCEICGNKRKVISSYLKTRSGRFCSAKCRDFFFAQMPNYKFCIICGKKFKDRKSGEKKYCSHTCYAESLKRSSVSGSNKYITEIVNGKRVYQHRIVVEKWIGRKLKRNEIVHHKDGNRSNNHPTNLEILSQSQHLKKHFGRQNLLVEIIKK